MPRLFPSLGRSSKEHARNGAYGQYEGYDAPQAYYDYGYPEQEPQQHRSGWSKVLSRKSTKKHNYPRDDYDTYARSGGYRTTVEDYPEDPRNVMPGQESFEDLLSARHSDNTVPLVQRESSLTRLQHAFADHGAYAPTMSAAPSQSHGAFYAPQPMPAGQPHLSAVNDMHEPPVVVNTPVPVPLQGMRPDISHRDHPAYWDRPLDPAEEPPVVVVVEHGKHGKKDKYYIIPGGAPVIFEDENGNELTRAGFSNDDYVSVGSDDRSHRTSRSGRSDHRGRSSHRSHDDRHAQDSYHNDPNYVPSRSRAGTRSSREDPEIYYVDPQHARSPRSGRSGSSDDTLVRSSTPRDHQSYHSHQSSSGRSHDRARGYGPDDRDSGRGADYHRRDHRSRRQ
ncbi:hypothetical protein BN946_scf185043.g126 [Trametes cinnabarina]|uniref:Uncharacterized protein n=1 Tax=Pycnoporus cinnabarinus TaxID=5643 RepID=A0A060SIP5_PYCCI|nr:hypothetical protein BN946_scf185043.g126 [Trametes cinnabarina]